VTDFADLDTAFEQGVPCLLEITDDCQSCTMTPHAKRMARSLLRAHIYIATVGLAGVPKDVDVLAEQALADLAPDDSTFRGAALLSLGAALALGQLARAERAFTEAAMAASSGRSRARCRGRRPPTGQRATTSRRPLYFAAVLIRLADGPLPSIQAVWPHAGQECVQFSKRWTRDSGIKQRLRILKRLGAVTDGCPAWQESKLL
jgi:MalT-like TPR region